MLKLKSFITVKVPVTGFHYWPKSPTVVSFLSDFHRHTFTIRVSLWVTHHDRAREFTLVKKDIQKYIGTLGTVFDGVNFGAMSCEKMSLELQNFLIKKAGYEVSEFRFISFSEDEEFEGGFETKV